MLMREYGLTDIEACMANPLGTRGAHWRVASPYFTRDTVRWIDSSIPDDVYRFERVLSVLGDDRHWHSRRSATSSLSEWKGYMHQAHNTFAEPSDGVIGIFPQLAAALSITSRIRRDDRPIVSWFFNTPFDQEWRRRVGAVTLDRVDRFVVHSTWEIEYYSSLLGMDEDRFSFVPLQYGAKIETERPAISEPYVFATGSGQRDYRTFFEAVGKLGYKTLVLASPRALNGLVPPPNVQIIKEMPKDEIRRHVRHATVNVIPLRTEGAAAGLVTIVECLRHGRGIVSTTRAGIEDYLFEGKNALLALPGNAESLAHRIEAVWKDDELSARLDANALTFANANCTDEAAAAGLINVLDGVLRNQKQVAA